MGMEREVEESRTEPTYEFAEIPLTSGIARPLVLEIFEGQGPKKNAEIKGKVENLHCQRGGKRPTSDHNWVKKTLGTLQEEGKARLIGKGTGAHWIVGPNRVGSTENPEIETEPELEVETEPEPEIAEHIIGDGPESVYVFYYPAYKELARLTGESNWPCKIGSTAGRATERIQGQGTPMPEKPRLAIVFKTDKSEAWEKALQNTLKAVGKHMPEAPGQEWFITTPEKIMRFIRYLLNDAATAL